MGDACVFTVMRVCMTICVRIHRVQIEVIASSPLQLDPIRVSQDSIILMGRILEMNKNDIIRMLMETDTYVEHKQVVYVAQLCCDERFISKLPPQMWATAHRMFNLLATTGLLTKDDLEKALEVLILYHMKSTQCALPQL